MRMFQQLRAAKQLSACVDDNSRYTDALTTPIDGHVVSLSTIILFGSFLVLFPWLRFADSENLVRCLSDGFTYVLVDCLMSTGKYSATSNNMKLVHWPVMGRLLHLVQRG